MESELFFKVNRLCKAENRQALLQSHNIFEDYLIWLVLSQYCLCWPVGQKQGLTNVAETEGYRVELTVTEFSSGSCLSHDNSSVANAPFLIDGVKINLQSCILPVRHVRI